MKNLGVKIAIALTAITAIGFGVFTYIKRLPKIDVTMIDYGAKKARVLMSVNKLMSEREYLLGDAGASSGNGYEINQQSIGDKMIFTIKKGSPIATEIVKQTTIDFKNQTKTEK